jgi:hypothetical protein
MKKPEKYRELLAFYLKMHRSQGWLRFGVG